MRDGLSVQRNKGGKRPHDVSSSSRAARGADGTRGARKSLGTEQALRTGVASVSLGGWETTRITQRVARQLRRHTRRLRSVRLPYPLSEETLFARLAVRSRVALTDAKKARG